jgi:hypothetical protein
MGGGAWDNRLVEQQEKALREQEKEFETRCRWQKIRPTKDETVCRYFQNRKAQLVRRRADLLRSAADKAEKSAASAPKPPKSKPLGNVIQELLLKNQGIVGEEKKSSDYEEREVVEEADGDLVEEISDEEREVVGEGDGEVSEYENPLAAGSSHHPLASPPPWEMQQQVGGEEDGRRSSMESDEVAQRYLKMQQQMLSAGALHEEHIIPKEYTPCRYFKLNKNGGCKQGKNCSFSHDPRFQELEVEEWPTGSCKYFARSGGCLKGKACPYHHVGKPGLEKKLAKDKAMRGKPIRESSTTITALKQHIGQMRGGKAIRQILEGVLQSVQQQPDEEERPWKKRRKKKNDR